MRVLSPAQLEKLRVKAADLARETKYALLLDNHASINAVGLHDLEFVMAIGAKHLLSVKDEQAFTAVSAFRKQYADQWIFGYFSYDLKNEIEALDSAHPDHIGFVPAMFFVPETLVIVDAGYQVICGEATIESFLEDSDPALPPQVPVALTQRVSRAQYLANVNRIREHIIDGDVYELNYCVEFYAHASIDPYHVYGRLSSHSPAPFGGFLKCNDRFLLCTSPERFIKLKGDQLHSQPIKGTMARGSDPVTDEEKRMALQASEKERAENLMIVDLVRNDLARSAQTGTVRVDELFGIYSFPQVHQMISTVSARIQTGTDPVEAIRNAFPMGSMTGAPKIRAMELIEDYEVTKRGLYSGAMGYFAPGGDFDFNVVIRSIQYNQAAAYVSINVGSAITYDSVPEQEYDECLLKAKAMMHVLSGG